MDAILCDISAFEYWRTPPCLRAVDLQPDESGTPAKCLPTRLAMRADAPEALKSIDALLHGPLKGVTLPVHLVDPTGKMHANERVYWHRRKMCHDPHGFTKVAGGVYVENPLQALMDLSRAHTTVQLVQLMYEACGLYALAPQTQRLRLAWERLMGFGAFFPSPGQLSWYRDADGKPVSPGPLPELESTWVPCGPSDPVLPELWKRHPLVTVEMLQDAADAMRGHQGYKRFKQAVRQVNPGSASPAETLFSMLASMSRKLGGEGLPKPLLNTVVPLPPDAARVYRAPQCVFDACWPNGQGSILPLDCEIDSARYHEGESQITKDSRRRLALSKAGISSLTVTYSQMASPVQWDAVADVLYEALGKPRPKLTSAFYTQRARLRAELFGPGRAKSVGY